LQISECGMDREKAQRKVGEEVKRQKKVLSDE
jgi:hypothetical protein